METKKVIVITDCIDVAYTEMKIIIEKECKKNGIENIDFSLVPVSEFSILNAAFLTRLLAEQCEPGTVLSIVINPQKHRSPRIYGELSNGVLFFGANTGALTRTIKDLGVKSLYEIHDPGFITFGGKFVHAPNIARILSGIPFDEFGKPFDINNLGELDLVKGSIVHIDNFGLMKIYGDKISYEEGQKFKIYKNGEYVLDAVFANRMMCLDDNVWSLYSGSSLDFPELGSVRNKYGFKEIDAKIGDIITWETI